MNNVLQYDEKGRPVFELTAQEMTAPVPVEHQGRRHVIYATLQLYKASEMKSYLRQTETTYEPDGDRDTVVIKPADDAHAKHFTDRYFVRVKGLNVTKRENGRVVGIEEITDPEIQKAKLEKNPDLKARIAKFVYGNIRVPKTNGHDPLFESALILDDIESDLRSVQTILKLYDDGKAAELELVMEHVFKAESEADKRKWEAAGGDNRTSRMSQGVVQTKHDYNEMERLYAALITELIGATVNGKPCTEENKADWIPLVPFFYKDFALGKLFQTSALKND